MNIRPAVPADKTAIAAFTTETFTWGDYVVEAFDEWLDDDSGMLLIATDDANQAVAMARWTFVAPGEVWGQGARVHPDHRRRGISSALTEAGAVWAKERGGKVLRLLTEEWNEAARGQVSKSGFRLVSKWNLWIRSIGDAAPKVAGNGGRRVPSEERLMPARESEAGPAFLAWSGSPLVSATHGLISERWTWHHLRAGDLLSAAGRRALWACPAGWVIAEIDDDEARTFWVSWLMAARDDAYRLIRVTIDRAITDGSERIALMLPAVDWLDRAAKRAGLEDRYRGLLYERAL
jgi:GNAT superfamily N-acetyltransferase